MVRLIRSHPRVAAVFALALVLALVASLHLGQTLWRLGTAGDTARAVADWMTPRYIAHHFDIGKEDLARALALRPGEEPNLTLAELARRAGIPPDQMIARVEALRPAPAGKNAQ